MFRSIIRNTLKTSRWFSNAACGTKQQLSKKQQHFISLFGWRKIGCKTNMKKNNKVSELHRPTYKSGSLFADTFTHLHVLVCTGAAVFQKQLHSSLSYVGDRTVGYFSIQQENAHVFCLIVFPLQLSINKLKTNQKNVNLLFHILVACVYH